MPRIRACLIPDVTRHAAIAVGLIALLCMGTDGCASGRDGPPEDSVTVEGVVTARGNEPFSEYVLETANGDLYVLTVPDSLREGFLTPSRLTVSGRLYDDEWNGRAYRHIEVDAWTEVD